MKYLHIMPDSIYSADFIKRINDIYNNNEHYFIIHQCDGQRKNMYKNVIMCNKVSLHLFYKIIRYIFEVKQVILHSLFIDKKMFIIFAILSVFMKAKFTWYVWSADLYREYINAHDKKKASLKIKMKELLRKIIIQNLNTIIVSAKKDYRQAVIWYGTKAKMVLAEYSYYLLKDNNKSIKGKIDDLTILLGHSASDYGRHKEILELLSKFSDRKIKIVSPLSYPKNDAYINSIISYGQKLFGDNFCPLTEWMSYEEYNLLLKTIDIAVIGGEVQMGAGNITLLLHVGKKVYLSEKNGLFEKFLDNDIKCFSIEEIKGEEDFFALLSDTDRKKNCDIVERMCSDEYFKEKWDKVLS